MTNHNSNNKDILKQETFEPTFSQNMGIITHNSVTLNYPNSAKHPMVSKQCLQTFPPLYFNDHASEITLKKKKNKEEYNGTPDKGRTTKRKVEVLPSAIETNDHGTTLACSEDNIREFHRRFKYINDFISIKCF